MSKRALGILVDGRKIESWVMDKRKSDEVEFHDKLRDGFLDQRWSLEAEGRLKEEPLWRNLKYYCIERKSIGYVRGWLQQRCRGKRVLDYGCGNGEESMFVARHGAGEVIGIDISRVAIENCRRRAAVEGLKHIAGFRASDGEALEFEDDHFDLAMEYGVLHHLDLDRATRELVRVLKRDGQMICTEALGHNPVIHLYRRRTPHLRTSWEVGHILRKQDFARFAKYFHRVDMRFFHLATLGAVPFRRIPSFAALLGALEMADGVLLRLPWLRWQAWQVVFILSGPKKETLGGGG